ncbi:ABC transporter substrate-binding protein [Roseomonas sp. BN140053]|uniref:ABC transporter substrate-binding protein n=1 Tax=Roseomonas sp. BN140053 TaxID=3391898 RepID=UPI0039E8AF8D
MHPVARRPLLLAAALGALCPDLAAAQGGGDGRAEWRLGALFPFSGPLSLLGDESFRGLELAIEERNAAGGLLGRPIRLLKGDAADPTQAVAEVRRLTGAERASAVFGTFGSALAAAASQVADAGGVPYLELGAVADELSTRGYRWFFRSCPRAAEIGRLAADAVPEVLAPGWGVPPASLRVVLLHEDAPFGASVAEAQNARLRERGLPAVEKVAYAPRSSDLSPLVQRLRSLGAEVVLHTGYPNEVVLLFRAFREAGWRPRVVVGAGAGYSLADTAHAVGPEFEGTLNAAFTQFEVNEAAAPGARPFVDTYKRRYGAEPRSGHSLANYAGAGIFLDAMTRAGGTDKDRLRAAILATDIAPADTATGWGARFDERGQNTRGRPFLCQWQNGRQVTVFPAAAAVAPLRLR